MCNSNIKRHLRTCGKHKSNLEAFNRKRKNMLMLRYLKLIIDKYFMNYWWVREQVLDAEIQGVNNWRTYMRRQWDIIV